MHFIHLDLGFGFFKIFLGFFKIDELFVKFLGWILLKWSYMLMHCITFEFSQCFMHFRCVLYMLESCVLVCLDWAEPMMLFLLHSTWSCIFHTYVPFFSFFWYYCSLVLFCFSLSLSLSLFRIVCTWHPSVNPLCPGTLFVPRHLLLLTLLHFTFDFVMRRPSWTSRKTSLNVAFIWNAKLSYRTFSIPLYTMLFTVKVGSLCVRSLWVVPLWSYSFLFQYAWIWLFHTSFHHLCSRYLYSSHSRPYI